MWPADLLVDAMLPSFVSVINEGASFRTIAEVRHHQLVADEPGDLGGTDTGPTPGELLLTSLGTCTAMTLHMYARRKEWPLAEVRVKVWFDAGARPDEQTTVIQLEIQVIGILDAPQRQRLLQIGRSCPMHKLLSHPVLIITAPVT